MLKAYENSTVPVKDEDKKCLNSINEKVIKPIQSFVGNEKYDEKIRSSLKSILTYFLAFSSTFMQAVKDVIMSNANGEKCEKEFQEKEKNVGTYDTKIKNIEKVLRSINSLTQNWESKITKQAETKKQPESSSSTSAISCASLLSTPQSAFSAHTTALSNTIVASSSTPTFFPPLNEVVVDAKSAANGSSRTKNANASLATRPAAQ